MKTLFLLRHAKSSWKDDSLDDFDRPLKKKGLGDAQLIGKLHSPSRNWPGPGHQLIR